MKSFLSALAAMAAMESSSTQRQSFTEPEPIPFHSVEYDDYRVPFKKSQRRHRKQSSIALRRKRNKIARKSRQINRS